MNRKIKIKLKIVSLIHSMFMRRICWADCVRWAYSDSWNLLKIDGAKGCREESKTHSCKSCYCGGWFDGKHFKDGELPEFEASEVDGDNLPF